MATNAYSERFLQVIDKLGVTIVKADGELNKALEDVRVVIKKQKTA